MYVSFIQNCFHLDELTSHRLNGQLTDINNGDDYRNIHVQDSYSTWLWYNNVFAYLQI